MNIDNSTLIAECIALNCSHGCKPTPIGARCYCSEGQQPNGASCEDIDECTATPDICDQLCKNVPNSLECSCVAGYELFNNTICNAINSESIAFNEFFFVILITMFTFLFNKNYYFFNLCNKLLLMKRLQS